MSLFEMALGRAEQLKRAATLKMIAVLRRPMGTRECTAYEALERNHLVLQHQYMERGNALQLERVAVQTQKLETDNLRSRMLDFCAAAVRLLGQNADDWHNVDHDSVLGFLRLKLDCGLGPNKGCGAKCFACLQRHADGWMARAKKAEAEQASTQDTLDMYARAWIRELGGRIRSKTYEIDALVLTTRDITSRAERFETNHRLVKEAIEQLTAIPPNAEKALVALKKAAE